MRGDVLPLLQHVRDCLVNNVFLESIEFWGELRDEALAFWQAEVMPLLELNASHKPRTPLTNECPGVVQEAIFRVSLHPKKLGFLLDRLSNNTLLALIPSSKEARLMELEQQRRMDQKTLSQLHASIANRRIVTLEEQNTDLQRQLQEAHAMLRDARVPNRRTVALEEFLVDLQHQVETLQRSPGRAHFE